MASGRDAFENKIISSCQRKVLCHINISWKHKDEMLSPKFSKHSPVKRVTFTPCEPNFPPEIKKLIGPQTDFFQG